VIISPKFRGFICTTAHPKGCEQSVRRQIEYVRGKGQVDGPKRVLVIGASAGYGLASRIVSAFGSGAATIGVFFERPSDGKRTATAGWYNSAAFEKFAGEAGLYAKSINGDAFSHDIKKQTIEMIKKDLGQIDMVVYSLASPRRTHPETGEVYNSVLKPIGPPYTSKTIDFHSGEVSMVTVEPANDDDIRQTVAVMGGEDWEMWIKALQEERLLADGAVTVAYSYIGPELTYAVYREGTIGRAKDHLEATAKNLTKQMEGIGGKAFVSVNKALVTQASSAIPVVPLYISILYKIMKAKGTHEGCIEQVYRLFNERLYGGELQLDERGRIRVDDWEMKEDIQDEVYGFWKEVNTDNIEQISDITGYRKEFFHLFGFDFPEIDYAEDINPEVGIPSIE
jgi:enoyl-[acyl-carrier protein] reductase / trans-2-enoyl-CoA reductase (NAD+)